jgi:hypothetical protein
MAGALARGVTSGPDLSGVMSDDSAPKRGAHRNPAQNRDEESPGMIDDIVESLMGLLFWRRKRRFDVSAHAQSIRAVSSAKLKVRDDPDDEVSSRVFKTLNDRVIINFIHV